MQKVILLLLLAVLFTGCSTIFSGTRQSIVFSAPAGTGIYMDGLKIAEVPHGYDAVSVTVNRRLRGADMVARREGYRDTHFYLRPNFNGTVFVNILMGPYMIVGGLVDVLSGAAVKYPNYIEVEMLPLNPAVQTARDASLDYLLEF